MKPADSHYDRGTRGGQVKTKTYDLITEGLLETITIGSRRLVTLRSIDALIEGAAMNRAA